jgi:neurotransmitter:Na+ symporter, NSS family
LNRLKKNLNLSTAEVFVANTTVSQHGQWSSRFAFILAATGSAVGLGNIWKFPYIVGENGGGAFVLVYLACVVGVGIPIMMAETMIGRRGRHSPINTMEILTAEAKADPNWHYLGWIGVIAGFLILSYYSVIAGWSMAYTVKAFFGSFFGENADGIGALYDNFIGSASQQIVWHSVFMLATMTIVTRGVEGGLEKAARLFVPVLFGLLILLIGYAMTKGEHYFQGLHFLFSPDFSKLSGDSVLVAMGQAFFSLGLGMGAIMMYGAYLPNDVSIGKTSVIIAIADTLVALLAGIAIFPLVFANGLTPDEGPGLIFKTLPIAFGNMFGGWLTGILFFVLLFFAALTSAVALIEPAVAWLVETHQFNRFKACVYAGGATWALGVMVALSFNSWSGFKLFGHNLFGLIDYVTSNLMLPIGGFCIAVFAGWIIKQEHSKTELALPVAFYDFWKFAVSYIAPAAVFLVFLHVVGVI